MQEILWMGKKIQLKNDKIRLAILTAQQNNLELDKAESFEAKMAVYDKIFTQYSDAARITREEQQNTVTSKLKKAESGGEENLSLIKSYISYLKLKKEIDRNILLIDSLEGKLVFRSDRTDDVGSSKKVTRPDDLAKLYDSILQNMAELQALGIEDSEESKENAARVLFFKGLRCFYVALSYSSGSKWEEAFVLLERALDELQSARSYLQGCKNVPLEELKKVDEIEKKLIGHKSEIRAKGFLDSLKATVEPNQGTTGDFLLKGLNSFDDRFAKEKKLTVFPPSLEPLKPKPFLFDLALGECEFPNLEARMKTNKSGFWGLFSR